MNDYMESKLNEKIEAEKYYMDIPIPLEELDLKGEIRPSVWPIPRKCIWTKYDYYQNYYFGKNANQIKTAQETSIFRGTFQNLSSIS